MVYNTFVFVAFSSNLGVDIIFASVTQLIVELVTIPAVYNETLTLTLVMRSMINVFVVFVICTMLSALLTYIAMIKAKLSGLMLQNLGLLDGMHEGLLIISKKEQATMFCNKQAQKITNNFLGAKGIMLDKDALKRAVFNGADINHESAVSHSRHM